jgi:hypothetical protein
VVRGKISSVFGRKRGGSRKGYVMRAPKAKLDPSFRIFNRNGAEGEKGKDGRKKGLKRFKF